MEGGRRIGRYVLGPAIATGGMASVHLARMLGKGGFGKTVAIKRLHAQYAREPEFVTLFQDEARVTSGLTHANIVMTLDVLEDELDSELCLVMEYVHGASLSQIQRTGENPLPLRIGVGILAAMLDGLHAAHEATDEHGVPLDIIHRDVSPQNVLVTFQGVAKIADFGVAKAAGRLQATDDGTVKGKIGYFAPEQLLGTGLSCRTDLYAAGVVLWETITRRRLIDFETTAQNLRAVLDLRADPPSKISADLPRELDAVVMRALERTPENRFASAKEMGTALRKAVDVATVAEIGDWLRAERPQLVASREASLAELQRAIGASGEAQQRVSSGNIAVASRASSGNIAVPAPTSTSNVVVETPTVIAPDEKSASSNWTGTGIPKPQPRWLWPTLGSVLVLGTAGAIFLSVARRQPPVVVTAAPARSLAPPEPRAAAASATSSAKVAVPAPSIELDDPPVVASGSSSARVPPPPTSTASAKPRLVASSTPRKCRIVPTLDSTGHTKFTEVCP